MNARQRVRYSRQLALPQLGASGQQKLLDAKVVIVGAGGLGVPVALYLAGAGVGHLTLVDDDVVELSNLQRQVIFTAEDIGHPKAERLAAHLRRLNDDIEVAAVCTRLTAANIEELIESADLVMDCCDNFATRYLVNDFCRALGKPWMFAALHQFRGHFALFTPQTACFRCLYPEQPVSEGNCSLAGVLGTVPGLMGLWQGNEALKHLLALPQSEPGQLWHCSVLEPGLRAIRLTADPECWCQGDAPNPLVFHAAQDSVEISWQQWDAWHASEAATALIDIRSEVDHQAGNAGGRYLSHRDILRYLESLEPNVLVALYCQRGVRSLALARELRKQGFEQVVSIRGGVERR